MAPGSCFQVLAAHSEGGCAFSLAFHPGIPASYNSVDKQLQKPELD